MADILSSASRAAQQVPVMADSRAYAEARKDSAEASVRDSLSRLGMQTSNMDFSIFREAIAGDISQSAEALQTADQRQD